MLNTDPYTVSLAQSILIYINIISKAQDSLSNQFPHYLGSLFRCLARILSIFLIKYTLILSQDFQHLTIKVLIFLVTDCIEIASNLVLFNYYTADYYQNNQYQSRIKL